MTQGLSRRTFVGTAAAAIGFYTAARSDEAKPPRAAVEKLNIAAVGVGGKGSSDCDQAAKFGNLVAICDIDENTLNKKAEKFPKAQKFFDFREMLEKLGKGVDAVVVSTPDHTHAPAAAMAMRAGKHVYCQKPLTHSVHEARTLRELAREHKVCTQMGNQGTALDNFRTSIELLQSGALGEVKEVHVWTNRPVWPQAPKVMKRPSPSKAPAHIKWDLFLGPAPERPYASGYHPFNWRGWLDFGTGALGDMACHTANMPFMGLGLTTPSSIEGEAGDVNDETFPSWARVVFLFSVPGRPEPIKFTWYEGKKDGTRVLPSLDLLHGTEKDYSASGSLIVAANATVYSPDDYGATRKLLGPGAKDVKAPKPSLPRLGGNSDEKMKAEWVDAITKGDPKIARSNFDYAGLLTESILLGNVAMRMGGKKLEYDGKKGAITNDESANKLLRREYREGWKL
jgi:predicted dehydrogenase